MKLLVFAHNLEAKSFLEHIPFKSLKNIEGAFQFEDYFLLVTGEGIINVIHHLTKFLSTRPEVVSIINYGVAGVLKGLEKYKLYGIRTVYAEDQFSSYVSSEKTNQELPVDCISANQRVLNDQYKKQLAVFAPLVDRELWAIGMVAKQFHLNWVSYKYTSDFADDSVNCESIKASAAHYSDIFFAHFDKLRFGPVAQLKNNEASTNVVDTCLKKFAEAFFFTLTQQRQKEKLVHELLNKDPNSLLFFESFISELTQRKLRPKERTKLLLLKMQEIASPEINKLKNDLSLNLLPLKEAGWEYQYHPDFEDLTLEIKTKVKNKKQLAELAASLNNLNWDKHQSIFDGELL